MSKPTCRALWSLTAVLLFLLAGAGCGDRSEPTDPPNLRREFGPVDQPIPPDGFLADLPPDERNAELARIAAGTPIEELPPDERTLIESSNESDRRRVHVREALNEFAKAQSLKARMAAETIPSTFEAPQ